MCPHRHHPRRRPRRSELGFALAIALILAVLYFGLIELLLIDSARELRQARRYRSRVIALTLAENAAEGAARKFHDDPPGDFDWESDQGTMEGRLQKTLPTFRLTGVGESAGTEKTSARVTITGDVTEDGKISILFAQYSQ